jgi:hypothetical protein
LAEDGILIRPLSVLVLIGRHMRASLSPTVLHGNVVLAIPVAIIAWVLAGPGLLTLPTFAALAVLLVGCAWVVKSSHPHARPVHRLARVVRQTDAAAREQRTRIR